MARILKIQELQATAMMDTPTYILGMAETARMKMDVDPSTLTIDKITCVGECGASIPSTKKRLEEAWGAKVYDHAGARNTVRILASVKMLEINISDLVDLDA